MLLNSPPQKTLYVFLLIVCVHGRPKADKDATILKHEYKQEIPGAYRYKYETSNGISHSEVGQMEQSNTYHKSLSKKGYFSYKGLDNIQYTITYVADEKGYRPMSHISHTGRDPAVNNTDIPIDKTALGPETDDDDDRIGTSLIISLSGGGVG